jgi:SAM-dependent methyltransferase
MAKAAAKAAISAFYGKARPALSDCIQAGLSAYGATPASATLQHLELFDSFHIGGSDSARHLFHNLLGEPSSEQTRVIDVGCGLGGPARLLASEWPGCSVTGVDITPEFVEVGNELSAWECVALSDRVTLVTAAAGKVASCEFKLPTLTSDGLCCRLRLNCTPPPSYL